MTLPNSWDLRIDADGLIYSCGFAADSRGGDLSHSLYNLKLVLQMLFTKFGTDYTLWLTNRDSSTNFRTHAVNDYKMNRAGAPKPKFYKEMRQYLVRQFNAQITQWGEADDWLGIDYKPNTVICTNDKDLLMIPCYHYRIRSEEFFLASDPGQLELLTREVKNKKTGKVTKVKYLKGYGFKWFCTQMLAGDVIDNIHKPKNDAVYKSGKKKGEAYRKGMGPKKIYEYLETANDVFEQWIRVQNFYIDSGYSEDEMITNAKLLWMARRPNEEFHVGLVEEIHDAILSQSNAQSNKENPDAA
jgi:hypothetical protein